MRTLQMPAELDADTASFFLRHDGGEYKLGGTTFDDMHTLTLIAGDKLDDLLWPFSKHNEVDPYEVPVPDDEIARMSKHYGISTTDLAVLAVKMQDYAREEGVVRDGRLFRVSRVNPKGRVDYYEVGGKWESFLQLRRPRPLRRFFGLLPAGSTSRVSSAKKAEIDQQPLLADPPAALLFQGQWFESPYFAEGEVAEKWRADFAQHFAQISDETTLTVVDVHS